MNLYNLNKMGQVLTTTPQNTRSSVLNALIKNKIKEQNNTKLKNPTVQVKMEEPGQVVEHPEQGYQCPMEQQEKLLFSGVRQCALSRWLDNVLKRLLQIRLHQQILCTQKNLNNGNIVRLYVIKALLIYHGTQVILLLLLPFDEHFFPSYCALSLSGWKLVRQGLLSNLLSLFL